MVTMVAFGGADFSALYVTTAHLEGVVAAPVPQEAADLYALETDLRDELATNFPGFQRGVATPYVMTRINIRQLSRAQTATRWLM